MGELERLFIIKETKRRQMIDKCVFPLASVQVRHKEPGNCTHLILLPRNYSVIAKSGTSFNFGIRRIAFHLLVVSTVSTFSTVSSLASKNFHSLWLPALHHSRSASIITYHGNTHCSHYLQPALPPHSLTLMIFGW